MLMNTMSRRQKGRVAPPPILHPAAQAVVDEVVRLPGVVAQAHWQIGSQTDVNGTDFYVGEEELGHIHLDGEAHIPLGPALVDLAIERGLGQRFRWSSTFVVVDTDAAPAAALGLFAVRHAQIGGETGAALRARIGALQLP